MYKQKVRDSIYTVTGQKDIEDPVVTCMERKVRSYLSSIKTETERRFAQRKKDNPGKTRLYMLDDLFEALQDTPEHYGVKRCIIVKKLARAVSCEDKPGSTDSYQKQLEKLNDGSESFRLFEQHRIHDLEHADNLTRAMSGEDYKLYSGKKRKASFTTGAKQFCEWLDWNPQPNPTIITVMGWLATYRIKRIVYCALQENASVDGKLTLDMLKATTTESNQSLADK